MMKLVTWVLMSSTYWRTFFYKIKWYLFKEVTLLNVLYERLFVFKQFLLHIFAICSSLIIEFVIFFLDIINNFPEIFHIINQNKNGFFEIIGEIVQSMIFIHVHFIDSDMLKIFRVDSTTKLFDLESYTL